MSQRQDTSLVSGIAAAATAKGLRVKYDSNGELAIAGDENFVGVATAPVLAADDPIAFKHKLAPGTQILVAGGAIAAGDAITTAASGKTVTGTLGAVDFGQAVTAAGGDGDLFEAIVW